MEKIGKRIFNICLTLEAILVVIGLIANYDIRVGMICFFGLFALGKIVDIMEEK